MGNETTHIRVYETDKERLESLGTAGDSIPDVVSDLLDVVDEDA